ncbi:MAG: hypothetical protein J4224_02140 [Candidatus Diapherotrites archaeon]|uniref:Uncharacterized protein n=1 Tax=Candidatus Iainarchaeum sp. TaxID=3101447 RepID=A0A8T4KYQ3_9ARCH|nr:hypothetical protein [Candidatus Diapherotrites archaeon]
MASQQVGSYAFLAGTVIAILVGLLIGAGQAAVLGGIGPWIPLVLIILGVVVGVLNIGDKEVDKFLIASIALLALAGSAGGLITIPAVGTYLVAIVQNIAVFVAPAALIVALKAIKGLAEAQ